MVPGPFAGGFTDTVRPEGKVADFLLDAAGLQPGQKVLDVGSGAGIASLRAAARVGPTGRLLGADISAPTQARRSYSGQHRRSRAHRAR